MKKLYGNRVQLLSQFILLRSCFKIIVSPETEVKN